MFQLRSQIFLWERSVLRGVDGKRKRVHFGTAGIVLEILLSGVLQNFASQNSGEHFHTGRM